MLRRILHKLTSQLSLAAEKRMTRPLSGKQAGRAATISRTRRIQRGHYYAPLVVPPQPLEVIILTT